MKKITEILAIKKEGKTVNIYIEGIIGYPSWMQHDKSEGIATTKEDLRKELKALSDLDSDVEEIVLNIDSPGGSVNHALSMFTALNSHPAKKKVVYTGNSASAATVIGAVAKKEDTYIYSYLGILIHEARTNAAGTVSEMKLAIDGLERANKSIAKIYSNQNGLDEVTNLALMSSNNGEGRLLDAKEALELGFVGNLIEIDSEIAAFNYNTNYYKEFSEYQLNKLKLINKTMNLKDFFNKKEPLDGQETGDEAKDLLNKVAALEAEAKQHTDNTITIAEILKEFKENLEAVKAETESLKTTLETAKVNISTPNLPKGEFLEAAATFTETASERIYRMQQEMQAARDSKRKGIE